MKLVETASLATDLEKGLGETHWLFKSFNPALRLRMEGVCGVASLAITEHLRQQGHEVDIVMSHPNLPIDPHMRHVFAIVRDGGDGTIIDSSYTQFLGYAGLTPGYVMFGGEDRYPGSKIESFGVGEEREVVDRLTLIARHVIDHRLNSKASHFEQPEFQDMSDEGIYDTLSEIWNPSNFEVYEPSDELLAGGKKLASFILPEHINLVA